MYYGLNCVQYHFPIHQSSTFVHQVPILISYLFGLGWLLVLFVFIFIPNFLAVRQILLSWSLSIPPLTVSFPFI